MLYIVLISPFVLYVIYRLWCRWSDSRRRKRRARQRSASFPSDWQNMLRDDFSLYRRMPAPLQRKLEGQIHVFLAEKLFFGRNGFEITDRARVLIAAQACLLILNQRDRYYPGFESILVYPDAYVAPTSRRDGPVQTDRLDSRLGESWHRGPVILAWNHVLQGGRDSRDGHNVVMHEFAHKLDEENYYMDGLPVLSDDTQYGAWKEVLTAEYERLRQHRDDVIDVYGATSPAEFFAVVTEAFFEKSTQLKQKHPALYDQFQRYYQLDPSAW